MSQNKKAGCAPQESKEAAAKALADGYKEMAELNLKLAQMCFDADNEGFLLYEEKLTECE